MSDRPPSFDTPPKQEPPNDNPGNHHLPASVGVNVPPRIIEYAAGGYAPRPGRVRRFFGRLGVGFAGGVVCIAVGVGLTMLTRNPLFLQLGAGIFLLFACWGIYATTQRRFGYLTGMFLSIICLALGLVLLIIQTCKGPM